jgi:hypothetical protein
VPRKLVALVFLFLIAAPDLAHAHTKRTKSEILIVSVSGSEATQWQIEGIVTSSTVCTEGRRVTLPAPWASAPIVTEVDGSFESQSLDLPSSMIATVERRVLKKSAAHIHLCRADTTDETDLMSSVTGTRTGAKTATFEFRYENVGSGTVYANSFGTMDADGISLFVTSINTSGTATTDFCDDDLNGTSVGFACLTRFDPDEVLIVGVSVQSELNASFHASSATCASRCQYIDTDPTNDRGTARVN